MAESARYPLDWTLTPRTAPMKTPHRYQTRQLQPPTSDSIDTTIRPLPFYDTSCELIQLTQLRNDAVVGKPNESLIEFKLTIEQADQLAMNRSTKHIILRFCQLESNTTQDDNFPPDVVITVNGTSAVLPPAIHNPNKPNVPAKRPGQHVDISKLSKLCPFVQNIISVKWHVDPTDLMKQYAIIIIIGDKLNTDILLQRIRDRGLIDPALTRRLIADSDAEVATTNLQTSLICPIGKMRMLVPTKSIKCQHIPCFDALCYLQMNERKPTWTCPVCNRPAYYPDLRIDGYFVEILERSSSNVTEVTLNLDGTWSQVLKQEQPTSAGNPQCVEIITISDDDD